MRASTITLAIIVLSLLATFTFVPEPREAGSEICVASRDAPLSDDAPPQTGRASPLQGGVRLEEYERTAITEPGSSGIVIFKGIVSIDYAHTDVERVDVDLWVEIPGEEPISAGVSPRSVVFIIKSLPAQQPLTLSARISTGVEAGREIDVTLRARATVLNETHESYNLTPAVVTVKAGQFSGHSFFAELPPRHIERGGTAVVPVKVINEGNGPDVIMFSLKDEDRHGERGVWLEFLYDRLKIGVGHMEWTSIEVTVENDADIGEYVLKIFVNSVYGQNFEPEYEEQYVLFHIEVTVYGLIGEDQIPCIAGAVILLVAFIAAGAVDVRNYRGGRLRIKHSWAHRFRSHVGRQTIIPPRPILRPGPGVKRR